MSKTAFFLRLVVAYVIGVVVIGLIFTLVAWLTGQLKSGIHSASALTLFLFPFAWVGAYYALRRANFPQR